eukprot:Ihof_evm6s54 gene=Ihof_evmTU6s54
MEPSIVTPKIDSSMIRTKTSVASRPTSEFFLSRPNSLYVTEDLCPDYDKISLDTLLASSGTVYEGRRKPKKSLGWDGFNHKIADKYVNVDGTAITMDSPCRSRKDKLLAKMINTTYSKDDLEVLSDTQLGEIIIQLARVVGEVSMENESLLKDFRGIQMENDRLAHRMAEICDMMNEDIIAKSQ